jgi:transposase InsO family protein
MVKDLEFLEFFEEKQKTVGQAEKGRTISSIGIGRLKCELMRCHSPWGKARNVRLNLRDVLVVPSLSVNIISVRKLSHSNFKVAFNKEGCEVLDQSGRLVARAKSAQGLYWFHAMSTRNQVLISTECDSSLDLWHRRLGHLNETMVRKMLADVVLDDGRLECGPCISGKMARAPFPSSHTLTNENFELIHSDVCGPMPVESTTGHRYFVTFIDDKSRYCFVYLLKTKAEVLDKFKEFLAWVQNVFEKRVKTLRSDNGGEFVSREFDSLLRNRGIQRQTTVAYTPQQNGVAERMNRTLMESVRSMLFGAKLPEKYWGYAVVAAAYVRNRCWSQRLKHKSPYMVLYQKAPDLRNLKVFGCVCYAQVPEAKRNKLNARAMRCVFLGYSTQSKAYIVQEIDSERVSVSRDVKFFENDFRSQAVHRVEQQSRSGGVPVLGAPSSNQLAAEGYNVTRQGDRHIVDLTEEDDESEDWHHASDNLAAEMPTPGGVVHSRWDSEQDLSLDGEDGLDPQPFGERDWLGSRYIMQPVDVPPPQDINAEPQYPVRRSYYRQARADETALVMMKGPRTFKEAMGRPDSEKWLGAMKEEMESLMKNKTWSLIELPKNRKTVDCRWVLGIKQDSRGRPERYKARLCARGFTQEFGVDYEETFSPVAHFDSIRMLLVVAVHLKMDVQQMDVKTAFLNGTLDEEIFMSQPPGFEVKGQEHLVCKLEKSLYGLKQSPRQWNITMDGYLNGIGFQSCTADPCIYVKRDAGKMVTIALYVDDLIIASNCKVLMDETKSNLNKRFDMKDLGRLRFCLGIEVVWNQDGTCSLSQRQYAQEVLERFKMTDCKPVSIPIATGEKLTKEMCPLTPREKELMAKVPYRSAVGSLIYLVTGTRPDLAVAVGIVSKYLENPGPRHWGAVKRIFRYLKGTIDLSLECKVQSLKLVGYCDADWAGDLDSRRSTTGYVFKLGRFPVSWKSKRQPTVALSTSEAEYMSLASAAQTAIWLRRLLGDLGFTQEKATEIFEDNQGCIAMAKNPVNHDRTKHIDIKYHFVRELLESGVISLTYLQTEDMLADVMTKGLARVQHERLCQEVGLHRLSVEGEC